MRTPFLVNFGSNQRVEVVRKDLRHFHFVGSSLNDHFVPFLELKTNLTIHSKNSFTLHIAVFLVKLQSQNIFGSENHGASIKLMGANWGHEQ